MPARPPPLCAKTPIPTFVCFGRLVTGPSLKNVRFYPYFRDDFWSSLLSGLFGAIRRPVSRRFHPETRGVHRRFTLVFAPASAGQLAAYRELAAEPSRCRRIPIAPCP